MKKMAMAIVTVLALSCLATRSFAHGGGEHVMGRVAAVEAKALTVETTEKKRVTIVIDETTKFEKSGAAATAHDLSPGDRVVVHTAKPDKSGQLKAVLVKFGQPAEGGSPGGHDHGDHDAHGPMGKE